MATLVTNAKDLTGACSAERGAMGLRGLFAQLGNSTWMVAGAVLLFLMFFFLQHMHAEDIGTLRELHVQEHDFNRQTLSGLSAVIERNSTALDALTTEIRKLRERQ